LNAPQRLGDVTVSLVALGFKDYEAGIDGDVEGEIVVVHRRVRGWQKVSGNRQIDRYSSLGQRRQLPMTPLDMITKHFSPFHF